MPAMLPHLRALFEERCQKNPRYSLRAFAMSLNVPASSLSEILSGKRPMSKKFIRRIGEELKIPVDQIDRYY